MLKKRAISLFVLTAILLTSLAAFVSCTEKGEDGESTTVKVNVKITGLNDELLCDLSDLEVTAVNPNVEDATRKACDTLNLDLIAEDGVIQKIGDYRMGGSTTEAASDEDTSEEAGEEGEEATEAETTTEAAASDEYFWLFYVNGVEATQGANVVLLNEGDSIEWKYTVYVPEATTRAAGVDG